MLTYRSSIHVLTGYSTQALVFGREIRLPLDVMICDQSHSVHLRYEGKIETAIYAQDQIGESQQ